MITFDRAGRLYSASLDGRFYRRGVDGTIVEKHRPEFRRLGVVEAQEIAARALDVARGEGGRPLIEDLEADAFAFRQAYDGAVAPLPPDLGRALVLQATVGCAYNACMYCTKYKDRSFRARTEAGFEDHVAAVVEAFGDGLSMRRGVFLGDADALFLDTDRLDRFCTRASALAPAAHGLYCFGGLFGSRLRSRRGWERLRNHGLRRVYLALDTGHDALRSALTKPGTATDALRLVRGIKGAGINVGLLFVLGVGGARAQAHVRDSAALVRAAFLDEDDFVYLSPLVDGKGEVDTEAFTAQEQAMRSGIGHGPRVSVYDVRAFVY